MVWLEFLQIALALTLGWLGWMLITLATPVLPERPGTRLARHYRRAAPGAREPQP